MSALSGINMKIKTMFFKFFILFLLNSIIIASILTAAANKNIKSNNIKLFAEELIVDAKIIMPQISSMFEAKKFAEMDAFIKEAAKDINRRLTVVGADGIVLADSSKEPGDLDNHSNRIEIKQSIEGMQSLIVRRSATLNEETLYISLPIYLKDGSAAGVLRASAPLTEISFFSSPFIFKNYLVFFIIIFLSIVISFFISKNLGSKISQLKKSLQELARGNFKVRARINTKDELGELSDAFNGACWQLQKAFKKIDDSRAELDKIISSVSDGILAVEKNGRVLLSNNSFRKHFDCDSAKFEFYWQALDPNIFKAYMENYREPVIFPFEHKGHYFSCVLTRIEGVETFVIVFHDITGIKNLEAFKKNLISAVSHELKTPISSMRLYLELAGDEQLSQKLSEYLRIIGENLNRLSDTTNDLLVLSEIESKQELSAEEFSLKELFEEMKVLFDKTAEKKKLELIFDIDPKLKIKADKFRLSQALSNLIDNALRYTEIGSISVSAFIADGRVGISVKDTGIGIARAHTDKIFERFYVVNKSRSRQTGGTGLGLSIVKHIIELHKGEITVESVFNKGTTFTIFLPLI